MFKFRKLLLIINRIVYLMAAAMLMAGTALTITPPKTVAACHPVDVCDVPAYEVITVLSDNLKDYLKDHPEDFEVKENKPCVAPKVTICHATSSATNPYVENIVSINSIANLTDWLNGHGGHADDIWPTFTARDGTVILAHGDQTIVAAGCVVQIPVCDVPSYATINISSKDLDSYLASHIEDFVIDGTHVCTPPIVYVPVCDVPTSIGQAYATIQVIEGELAAWLLAHPEDHPLSAGGICGPTWINVCIIPDYTLTQVDQIFVEAFIAAHTGSFVATPDKPCEPQVPYCHYDAAANLWTELNGYASEISLPDYVLGAGESCPEKVPYCFYDASSETFTAGWQYPAMISLPDILMPESGNCPVKVPYCIYDEAGYSAGMHFPWLISPPDMPMPESGVCPVRVPYCIYDAATDSYTAGTQFPWKISPPDILMPPGGECPVKVPYCRYDSAADTWTQGEIYSDQLIAGDFLLGAGEVCPQKIIPTAECVWNNGNDTVDAIFGYGNPNPSTITIPIGEDNDLSGTGAYLGGPQPTDFVSGSEPDAFIVTFLDTKMMSWFVKSPMFSNGETATITAEGKACKEDPKKEPDAVIMLDPYCYSVPGTLMQWTVENPNDKPFIVDSWEIDGVLQSGGFIAPVGENLLTTTPLGTHRIDLFWGLTGHAGLSYTINSCTPKDEEPTPGPTPTEKPKNKVTPQVVPTLPIPVTGSGEIIPVTGNDLQQPINAWVFGGFGMLGIGMVLTGLRRKLGL